MKIDWITVVIAGIILALIGAGVTAEYTNSIPCSWYSHTRTLDVPARCLSNFNKR